MLQKITLFFRFGNNLRCDGNLWALLVRITHLINCFSGTDLHFLKNHLNHHHSQLSLPKPDPYPLKPYMSEIKFDYIKGLSRAPNFLRIFLCVSSRGQLVSQLVSQGYQVSNSHNQKYCSYPKLWA